MEVENDSSGLATKVPTGRGISADQKGNIITPEIDPGVMQSTQDAMKYNDKRDFVNDSDLRNKSASPLPFQSQTEERLESNS